MMIVGRTRVELAEVTRVDGCDDISVAILTNPLKTGSLNVVIEKAMAEQIKLRLSGEQNTSRHLPEALASFFQMTDNINYEIEVYDIRDGEYLALLFSLKTGSDILIRLSDAILLSIITHIPIYVNNVLMERQLSPYTPHPEAVPLPINAISIKQLNAELQEAIDAEDYHLAGLLQKELNKRNKSK